ncbi:MAG: Mur ligase family protein [Pseudomonadota bacterium]
MLRATPSFVLRARLHRRFFIHKTNITAVVGSFGKTTTTQCIAAALDIKPPRQPGGNSGISLAENILQVKHPDAYGVIEVGISGKGQMARHVKMVRPDITVVTSIGSEHNRSLGTLDVTRHEKAYMVRALGKTGLAVLNGDDPNVLWMKSQTQAKVVTFGLGPDNHFRASDIRLNWPMGTCFKLHSGYDTVDVTSPFLGKHMVYPVLAAAAVAHHHGVDLVDWLSRVARLDPMQGRIQPVLSQNGAIVLRDDYKAAAETIHAALDLMEEIPVTRKFIVLGEVNEPCGNQDQVYRRIGERLGKAVSRGFFLCSTKSFRNYSGGAVSKGFPRDCLCNAGTNGLFNLITMLQSELKPGDVLLVKGRNSQRLERIAFALQGRKINCLLPLCDAQSIACWNCPMLEQGWPKGNIVF